MRRSAGLPWIPSTATVAIFAILAGFLDCRSAYAAGPSPTPTAGAFDPIASAVLGQSSLFKNAPNTVDAQVLSNPMDVAIDKSATPNHLYVADFANNRVLGYVNAQSFANGAAADLVVGQSDSASSSCNFDPLFGLSGPSEVTLCGPDALAVDSSGNLYVSDSLNNRVLIYASPFMLFQSANQKAGFSAAMVLGQGGDFFAGQCNVGGSQASSGTLCAPAGLALDGSNNLFVTDSSNNRALEFNNPIGTGAVDASIVFGQLGSFTTNAANPNGPTANSLSFPTGVAVDSNNNLYIADQTDNRVLEYNTPLTTDTTADLVFGQANFTSDTCNANFAGAPAQALCAPTAVAVDGAGDLFVADATNNRVLQYLTPLKSGAPGAGDTVADAVFGQAGRFSTTSCNLGAAQPSASTLCIPEGVTVDNSNNLFVADGNNNRALFYPGLASTASSELGEPDFVHQSTNSIDAQTLSQPGLIAIDFSSVPNHLYVADTGNNRVLAYTLGSSFSTSVAADLVVGQADFFSGACNAGAGPTAATLCQPTSVAIDTAGNLFVADTSNHRALVFPKPYSSGQTAGEPASVVFGQSQSFTTNLCNLGGSVPSATTLCAPSSVALDSANDLYIADTSNNRVLEYNAPLSSTQTGGAGDTVADAVFGQGSGGTSFGSANSSASSTGLDLPEGAALDSSNNVYITDRGNNRVLEFNQAAAPPNNFTASTVFGQSGSFTTSTCNKGGSVNANTLCFPESIELDSLADLFVADTGNNRVLEYITPLVATANPGSGDTVADVVFGQGEDFTSNLCNLARGEDGDPDASAGSLCSPAGVAFDSNLYVADQRNNRLLQFLSLANVPGQIERPREAARSADTGAQDELDVPEQLEFTARPVGSASRWRTLTLQNVGSVPATIGPISAIGDFAAHSSCGAVLPAGLSCSVFVKFKPVTAGRRGGRLEIIDDARGSPHVVALAGKGKRRRARTRQKD